MIGAPGASRRRELPNTMREDDAPRWAEIDAWLDQALAQPDAGRLAWLAAQPMAPALRRELEALLEAEQASRTAFEPAVAAEPAGQALAAGDRIGVWRVEAWIGRGGSGDVYRVQRDDGHYAQAAALKWLRRPDDEAERRRFEAERRLLARLEHPAIARLIDGGAHAGRLYAVMEFVDGEPFDRRVAGRPLAERLALFEQVVAAVAHAHARQIVHRDLKPANVLVDAAGQVRLLDFGIARELEPPQPRADAGRGPDVGASARDVPGGEDTASAAEATQTLHLTPSHCAPEQLQGGSADAAADVYALGVMLHETLTGEPLWRLEGSGLQRTLQRLTLPQEVPPPSRRLRGAAARAVRGDLDAIVAQCLRPRPQDRYAGARALGEDLARHRERRPVQARGDAPGVLLAGLLRRHRVAVGAGAAVLASLVAALLGVGWQAREAARERDLAREEAAAGQAMRDVMLSMFRTAAEQPPGSEPGARALLAQTAERLERALARDPAQAADTLLALAQLHFQLNDYVGARPLFERLLSQAERLPAALQAQARMDLAQCLWRAGELPRAAALLAQAQAHWQALGPAGRNRLLDSRLVEAQILRADGRGEQAVRLLAEGLPQRIAVSGERHVETAAWLNNLATARYHAGQLAEARADYARAWALWQALGAPAGTDALNTLNNWAALSLREGRSDEAERLFREALALRRSHLPPSAAQAALQNNLGKLLLRRGEAGEALPLLEDAVALGERYAGPASPHTLAALAGVAEAQIALARLAQARTTLDELARRVAPLGEAHLMAGMAELAGARWHAARRDWARAHAQADRAEAIWRRAGAPAAPYLAQAGALRAGWPSRDAAGDASPGG
ncbi:serine/threonine-protein kinase [Piscinibacter sakaiensis]|uniref:Protein kinase domain-containing protein n=1 Tax=Piscinibacter sakaiensis TaxID=1547922 RepID=A0A0K8NX53_PISS1|nr:serine/threonine-protein kinase [Piscinibacter sakaiensis]GAP34510.1 hypothetical protein ISF6_4685 [Piscinibacter sakaiensis]